MVLALFYWIVLISVTSSLDGYETLYTAKRQKILCLWTLSSHYDTSSPQETRPHLKENKERAYTLRLRHKIRNG